MFGPKSLSLPSPFTHDHRPPRLYSEPERPQPAGQCHFLTQQTGSREQRCPCQGYQHNRNSSGSVCDCTHAACYHAPNQPTENAMMQEKTMGSSYSLSNVMDRVRKLEDTVRAERELRENMATRQRQLQREVEVLNEALTPFYQSEQEMRQRLSEAEERLENSIKEQVHFRTRLATIEDAAAATPAAQTHNLLTNTASIDQRARSTGDALGPHDTPVVYSGSEGRTSTSEEPMSPKPNNNIVADPESPRSSGILNLIGFPRPAVPYYAMPPRLSPPIDAEEPRSSGFLSLDVRELINRRRFANGVPSAHAYCSPSSSTTMSPPVVTGRNMTPQSLPRVSPPNLHANGAGSDFEDRAYKKRKHQAELMALDVLANVSAASPVLS